MTSPESPSGAAKVAVSDDLGSPIFDEPHDEKTVERIEALVPVMEQSIRKWMPCWEQQEDGESVWFVQVKLAARVAARATVRLEVENAVQAALIKAQDEELKRLRAEADLQVGQLAHVADEYCEQCGTEVSGTHWHCAKCGQRSGMMGHSLHPCPTPGDHQQAEGPREAPPKPRVWNKGDAEPVDDVTLSGRGFLWSRPNGSLAWQTPEGGVMPWSALVAGYSPLTEVSSSSPSLEGGTRSV